MKSAPPLQASSATLALLIWCAARSGTVHAQFNSDDFADRRNFAACIDPNQPLVKRRADCKRAVDSGTLEKSDVAKVYLSLALAFQASGDDVTALQDFNAAIMNAPEMDSAWMGRGRLYASRGNWDDARRDFDAAVGLAPRSALVRSARANFYVSKADYPDALLDYNEALKIAPDDPLVHGNRGIALNALGRTDDAIADFTRAIALDPHDLTAYSHRASLYLASRRLEPAIADLSVLIRADPANGRAFYDRGTAYERSGAFDLALDDYRNSVRLEPSFAPAVAAFGRLLKDKDPDAALSALDNAIRLDPRSPALKIRATLYLSLGRLEQALQDFDQVVANDSADGIAYQDRGVANEKLENFDDAIRDYSRSMELAPSVAARVNRGNLYARLQQPAKALADFAAALEMDPACTAALLGRADENHVRKLFAASLEDYARVIELDPSNVTAYFKRGNVHFDLREFAAAVSDYSKALTLDPDQPVALYNRALAAARLGRNKEVARDRETAPVRAPRP